VRAPGYLPFHTRLFTDRDDKLTVRLHRADGAAGLLGYRRTAVKAAQPSDTSPPAIGSRGAR
jgi:hypothetical protein